MALLSGADIPVYNILTAKVSLKYESLLSYIEETPSSEAFKHPTAPCSAPFNLNWAD